MNTQSPRAQLSNPLSSAEIIANAPALWEQLDVLPNVREHQARVAAVLCVLRDNWITTDSSPTINWDDTIAAALLHDLGNITKADLSSAFSQQLMGPLECERLDHWIEQQAALRAEFGNDEIAITLGLMKQIGAPARVQEIIWHADFIHNEETAASKDWDRKLLAHADHCVGPFSIMTVRERLIEGAKRYGFTAAEDNDRPVVQAGYTIATQVQAHVRIPLDSITEELAAQYIQRFLPRFD